MDCVPSNVQSAREEALLYVFEDNEAVIKMIMKGRSPTMRHVSRIHRVAPGCSIESIWTPKSKSRTSTDTKNQLAEIQTKGNFTRDEWKHMLFSFSISHFSFYSFTLKTMAKRLTHQDGSGELDVLLGQSIVLGDIKAEILWQNENPLNHQSLLQQYIEQIESFSPESKVSRSLYGSRFFFCVLLKLDNIS